MSKRFFRNITFLALFTCFSQLLFPFAGALASSNILPLSDLTTTHVTPDDVRLTWSTVSGATGYKVYEMKDEQSILHGETTLTSYNLNNLPEGSYQFFVSTLSSEGELEPSVPISFTISYEITAPTNFTYTITNDNNVTLKWDSVPFANYYTLYQVIDGKKFSAKTLTGTSTTFSNLPDGDYHFIVHANSFYYGQSPEGSPLKFTIGRLIVDTEAPVTTIHAPKGWTTESTLVNLTATDNETGVANTYYSINGSEFTVGTSFTLDEKGIHTVSFYSVDKAGNKEELQTADIKIDQNVPEASWDFNDEYELGSLLALNYTTNDDLSGVQSEALLVNGVQFENGAQISLDKPGEYLLQLTVTDNAGWVTTLEKTITVYIPIEIKVNPGIINHNTGKFTVEVIFSKHIEEEYGFALETVTLNGVKVINETSGDRQKSINGLFKFNREDFVLVAGETLLQFRGILNGYSVVGSATIKVIN